MTQRRSFCSASGLTGFTCTLPAAKCRSSGRIWLASPASSRRASAPRPRPPSRGGGPRTPAAGLAARPAVDHVAEVHVEVEQLLVEVPLHLRRPEHAVLGRLRPGAV